MRYEEQKYKVNFLYKGHKKVNNTYTSLKDNIKKTPEKSKSNVSIKRVTDLDETIELTNFPIGWITFVNDVPITNLEYINNKYQFTGDKWFNIK